LMMMISDRGHMGETDPWQTEGGRVTRHVLDALHIVHDEIHIADEVESKVSKAMTLAQSSLSPVALLLTRDLMWESA
jgi:sulfopyruvate decarboxylase subunit alpha